MKALLSNKKLIIYWAIVIVIIITGFVVGSRTEREKGSLSVPYGETYKSKYSGGLTRDSVYVGDIEERKYTSWYGFDLKIETQYYLKEGNVEVALDKSTLEEMVKAELYKKGSGIFDSSFYDIDFCYFEIARIIIVIVIFLIMIFAPIAIPKLVKKIRNKKTEKKQNKKLKELKKLSEMKEMGLISQEEFEEKKNQIMGK